MSRGFSPVQERGLIILVALAIVASGVALLIPAFNRTKIPSPAEIVLEDIDVILPEFLSSSPKVDINRAGVDELSSLPGIGDTLAKRIIAYRNENGPFRALEELKGIKGIGDSLIEKLRGRVSLGAP